MDLTTGIAPDGGGGSAAGTFERRRSRRSATLADNERIRVVLNCIYHMVCLNYFVRILSLKVESLRREELITDELCSIFEQRKVNYHSQDYTFSISKTSSSETNVHASLRSLRKQFLTELGFYF